MKGFVKSFLEAVNSRKDLKSVVDEKYFEGIPTSFSDAGTKCPSAFFMFDHQDEDEEDIKKTFHDHHLPTSYDDSIYSDVEQAKKTFVRKGWKPQVQSKEDKYKAFIDSIASRDNGTYYTALCRVFDPSVTPPVTLGKLIQTVDGKITSSISDNKNPFFSRLMAIVIATKCVALEKKDDTLMEQANGIESFLSYAIYATIPNDIGKKFDEIKDSTIKLVQEILSVSDKDKIKSYFKTLNLLDQIHTTIRDERNWNYRFFSKDPNNAFIDFDENGKIIPFEFDTKIVIDSATKTPCKIQEILDKIKTSPEDSSLAYSLIQKVACTVTKTKYPETKDDINTYTTINLESLSAEDAQTVLLTTLNLLSTVEKDIDPSKKEAFDKLVTTLVLPATEIDGALQEKKNVVDKVKDLCTTDPEISAVPGISDMFTPKAEDASEKDKEIARLTAERDDLSTKKNDLEREKAEKDEEIADLTTKIEEKDKKIKEQDKKISDLTAEKDKLQSENENKDKEIEHLKTAAVNATPRLKKPQDPYKMALGWLKAEIRRMSKKATKKGEYEKAEKLNNLYTNIEFYKNNIDPNDLDSSIKKTNIANQRSLHIGMHYCSDVAARTITTNEDKKDVKKSLREKIIPRMLEVYGTNLPDGKEEKEEEKGTE